MQRTRIIIVSVTLFAAAAALAYWSALRWNSARGRAVQQTRRVEEAARPATPREEVTVQNPTLKHTEGGRLAWQVQLSQLKITSGAQSVAAAGMREALIYDKTGAPIVRVTAKTARGNTSDRNLEIAGDVRAASHRGALITTDQVRWLEKERRLYCPRTVTVRSGNAAMTATGLSYYVDTDLIKTTGAVRMYNGPHKFVGRQLVYNVKTQAFDMKDFQGIFIPSQARELLAPGGAGPKTP